MLLARPGRVGHTYSLGMHHREREPSAKSRVRSRRNKTTLNNLFLLLACVSCALFLLPELNPFSSPCILLTSMDGPPLPTDGSSLESDQVSLRLRQRHHHHRSGRAKEEDDAMGQTTNVLCTNNVRKGQSPGSIMNLVVPLFPPYGRAPADGVTDCWFARL